MLSGYPGNDIPSCLAYILNNFLKDLPEIKMIILWSADCIPQNKNRRLSLATLTFLEAKKNFRNKNTETDTDRDIHQGLRRL